MEYLATIAIGYYILVCLKVMARLFKIKFRWKEFYDDKMSFHLGMFVVIHALAFIVFVVVLIIKAMVHATL